MRLRRKEHKDVERKAGFEVVKTNSGKSVRHKKRNQKHWTNEQWLKTTRI